MTTLTRQGDAYVTTNQSETEALRFMPVGNGYYVAQVQMQTDKGPSFLYGLVRLDDAVKTAATYATTAGKADFGPGLVACPDSDDTVCLTDLRPYIDHAMALAASNGPADAVYNIDLVR